MSLSEEFQAIRLRCALSETDHVACLRISGEDAFAALDAVCPAELYLRDGQMLHSLLLSPVGSPVVDMYVCRDDEDFILLGDGLPSAQLVDFLRDAIPSRLTPQICDLSPTHRVVSLGGPWAWELMSDLVGPGVVGLPYLTFFHEEAWTCFRAGKTGEFGYDILVRREEWPALRGRLWELGRPFDLGEASMETLDQCALENWFFNIRREGQAEVTPLELQLQWRISYEKDYPGSAILRERRAQGISRRITCAVASKRLSPGDEVTYQGKCIGHMVNTGYSPVRGDWVGLAFIERGYAHAGIGDFLVASAGHKGQILTIAPPVIHNRSLFVQPQKHSYRSREEHSFPPLIPSLRARNGRIH